MFTDLKSSLAKLIGLSVIVGPGSGYPENGQASVMLTFADATRLQAEYWRLIKNGRASFSSFDHQQKYGLSATIDAVQELRQMLEKKVVMNAIHDEETGDLLFEFSGSTKLQILNVTGYEIWEVRFPDGTGEYSNYAK